jgi:DNA-binding PadR family transcriptional regulator
MHNHHNDDSCGRGKGGFGGFGPGMRGFRPPFGGMPGHGHGHSHGGRGHGGFGGPRARRGDVRDAVLRLLDESPMHGYQMIQELGTRSGGAWRPSAGSVYPTLQLLEDEGLLASEETSGKRVYSLTETGKAAVAEKAGTPAPWEEAAEADAGTGGLRESAGRLMQAIFQIGQNGSAEQTAKAVEILNQARKEIYALLAED